MLLRIGERASVYHIDGAGERSGRNVNDLHIPAIHKLADDQTPFFPSQLRERRPGCLDYVLRFVR